MQHRVATTSFRRPIFLISLSTGQLQTSYDTHLGQRFDPFERGNELEGDESLLVPPDVLEQEGVLEDVFVGKVELDLVHDLLDQILRRRLQRRLARVWPGVHVAVGALEGGREGGND